MNPQQSKRITLILAFFLSGMSFCMAQEPPIQFGDVDIKDLQMTVYEADTSAPAIVLCSYGTYKSRSRVFTHTLRVKILKKEAYYLANRKFRGRDKSRVKGFTYNLVDGEITKDELTEDLMYCDKDKSNTSSLSVAMPNVREGSVIDLEIEYYGFPLEWYFQEDIPVVWSELRINPPENFRYRKNFFGYEDLTINEDNRWVAENVPAFIDEPYMDSRENYITKFEMDVVKIIIPGYYSGSVIETWEKLSENLLESTYFGKALKTGNFINRKAKEILETYDTDEAKLKAAVEFIHEVEFNGRNRYHTTNISFSTTYKERRGNSADINLMLIKLLRKMDFSVYPVILGTRENGLLSPVFPSKRRLNYVMAYVELADDSLFIDATDHLLPYYLVPEKCLNWRGRIVDEDRSEWVNLTPKGKDKKLVYYKLRLEEDLSLSGTMSKRRSDYAAHDFREAQEDFRSFDDYVETLSDIYSGLVINSAEIKNLDSVYLPVTEIYEVEISDKIVQIDSTLYFSPILFEQKEENPFKSNERKYPVDYSYPIEKSGILNLTIPQAYEIMELPKSEKFVLPDNAGSFEYNIKQMGNVITLKYILKINQTKFVLDEYQELKAFYQEIINKEAQPLIVRMH